MQNNTELKGAEFAKGAIQMLRQNKKVDVRRKMAAAICARPAYALYTADGFAEWDKYLAAGCPAA